MTHVSERNPEDRRWLRRFIGKALFFIFVVFGLLALFSIALKAQEPTTKQYTAELKSGLICDTKAEVVDFMDSKDHKLPQGCGYLQKSVFVRITHLEGYESVELTAVLVMYEIPLSDELVVQYGVIYIKQKGEEVRMFKKTLQKESSRGGYVRSYPPSCLYVHFLRAKRAPDNAAPELTLELTQEFPLEFADDISRLISNGIVG